MGINDIAFPNLGVYLQNIPKSFSVMGIDIALYGVLIGLGMLAGILLVARLAKRTGQNPDLYWDFSIYAVFFSVIGARIYYVAFRWEQYRDNILSVFNTRSGGMAIYGGVIAAFITLFIYARIKKANALLMADTGILGLLLGQMIGRWGNFTNREAFGQYTNNQFAMRLPVEAVRTGDISESIAANMIPGTNYIQVHPTFLYESLWNLVLLILLLGYFGHKKFNGEITLLYLAGYSLGRIWIEALRTDQLLVPGTQLPISQLLAIVLLVGAVLTDIFVLKNSHCYRTTHRNHEK